jgi:hypothetical protein
MAQETGRTKAARQSVFVLSPETAAFGPQGFRKGEVRCGKEGRRITTHRK